VEIPDKILGSWVLKAANLTQAYMEGKGTPDQEQLE
jgi:hypothetical protein